MQSKLYKVLCLLLVLSLAAGLAVGCVTPAETLPGTVPTTIPGTTLGTPGLTTAPTTGTVPTTVTTAPTIPTTAPTEPTTTPTEPTTTPTEPTTTPTEPTTTPTEPTTTPTEPDTTVTQPSTDPNQPPVQFPTLHGKYAFMYDTRSQEFIYLSHDASTQWYPASTTKMFTAHIAMQYLPIDMVITITDELDLVHSDSSVAKFRKGDILTVMDVLYGLFLPSGCDAAYILAIQTGRILLGDETAGAPEATAAFVTEMNRLAQEMGMVNTNFVTVDGYHDPEHYISLQSFATIANLCLGNEHIVKASSTHTKALKVTNTDGTTRTLNLRSTNKLLNQYSRFYNQHVVGLKTGSHSHAGANLVAAFQVDGGYILIGLFGYFGDWDLRFTDANALFKLYQQLEDAA